jgi:hypothetical protein
VRVDVLVDDRDQRADDRHHRDRAHDRGARPYHDGASSDPDDESREITASECKTIAGKFKENTIADEMAKLSPKLTDAQRETSRTRIEEAADQLGQRWEKGCVADLLGKAVAEKSLRCAMASKTVAALDACLSGQSP